MKKPIVIGITGGTGSGKSTIAREIYESFNEKNITMIEQDSYYKDQSNLEPEERVKTNYDHPKAFDNDLLIEHIKAGIRTDKFVNPQVFQTKEH